MFEPRDPPAEVLDQLLRGRRGAGAGLDEGCRHFVQARVGNPDHEVAALLAVTAVAEPAERDAGRLDEVAAVAPAAIK